MRINLISRHNPNTDIKRVKAWIQTGLQHPLLTLSTSRPNNGQVLPWMPVYIDIFLCGPCRQEQRQTYQHLWHKTPPSHPLSVYVFLSPTISSLPSFVPSCQCYAKEPSPFSLTHLSCPFMMVSPFLILSLSLSFSPLPLC